MISVHHKFWLTIFQDYGKNSFFLLVVISLLLPIYSIPSRLLFIKIRSIQIEQNCVQRHFVGQYYLKKCSFFFKITVLFEGNLSDISSHLNYYIFLCQSNVTWINQSDVQRRIAKKKSYMMRLKGSCLII